MAQIDVSYDSNTCTVVCKNLNAPKGTVIIKWEANNTVIDFTLSNFSPAGAFSTLPSANNNWTGTVLNTFDGDIRYDISVKPKMPGNCSPGTFVKTPQITINPANEP